jgi:hypothetical protein
VFLLQNDAQVKLGCLITAYIAGTNMADLRLIPDDKKSLKKGSEENSKASQKPRS